VELAAKVARLASEAATTVGVRLDAIAATAKRLRRAAAIGYGADDMSATYLASFGGGARPPAPQVG
jgi:3-hydroxyisobutyrate dehydrogenase-like beta-hydroxyacid dehydrogenase